MLKRSHSSLLAALVLAMLCANTHGRTCGDGSVCPDESTCCKTSETSYGCCPLKDAVCCKDFQHCCPPGTTCGEMTCDKTIATIPWLLAPQKKEKNNPIKLQENSKTEHTQMLASSSELSTATIESGDNANAVICPDPTRQCPDGFTCCLLPNHQWVCCPLPRATCCADGYHCCPYGSHCDPSSTYCYRGSGFDILLAALTKRQKI